MSSNNTLVNKNDYTEIISNYNTQLNNILKNKLPAVTNTDELIEIASELKDLKQECKHELINIINKNLITNYETFQRNIELQKTTIGLNYTKYHQNVKLTSLAPKNETLQHFKQIILLNKKQEYQFELVRKYIKVLYCLKPLLIDLSKNFILLKQKLKCEKAFFLNSDSNIELNIDFLIPEFNLIFKTCEIYNSLDTEVQKIFPDLNKYDIFETQFSKKILPCVDIPDEPITIVKQSHSLLLSAISKMFIESSKNLEQNNKIYKKTDIKYSEVLDISLKSFPLLNENETGVKQYIKYIQSIISDASRDIITSDTQAGKINNSLFKLLKVASAIINTHIDILSNYYSDRTWLIKVMEGILLELDVQSGLIIDMILDSLIRESIGSYKDILEITPQDFKRDFDLENFVKQLFEIIGVWNMFEKFFCFKYTSFTHKENENSLVIKPKCLINCNVDIKIKDILGSVSFKNILRENIQLNINTIFKMETIPDINRYINSFEKIDLDHDEVDFPVSSILDDFSIIFKKYLILFINTGNFQIFEEFLQNICLTDFINNDFIKTILNKLGSLSIVTTNLCQYLEKEKLNLLQQMNSGSTPELIEQEAAGGKSLFNLQHYTATIFQQQQQAMKLGKDLINSSKQSSSNFVISNNITDDVTMKDFHLLLIYINTISSIKPVLHQLLIDELIEPEYNSNEHLSANKSVIGSTFVFEGNAEVLTKEIMKIVDSSHDYISKIISNYTLKMFQIGVKNNLFEFSRKILNSEKNKFIDIGQDTTSLPALSTVGEFARGFKFSYVCSSSDLSDLSDISEFIKKIELLLQPYENVMLPNVYYIFKLKVCEFLNDFVFVKKIMKIAKINSLGIIKLEKEVNSIIKALCFDNKKGLIDYSLKIKFDKLLQIIEVLNFDESDFQKITLEKDNIDISAEVEDSDDDEYAGDFVHYRYVLNKDLKELMEWLLTNEEINRIRMILV
ncbi:hypothetical protein HANVADRAFT_52791 [Hanseniaspora valbyensis NRRL Y-1626]|uniref:COG4 transport protein middle alpha-helical bundle domain-containing protein n=1 Tax=Hanseniaspora valbyensis NRRL Y-1626 TaxID=766949 RepID=A0A1B7TDG4_9ASCO|nr:hypothetical protein HANVADRAFT_52791 [Hanseniaspora valbyensis NRRL Y-1626]